MKWSLGVCIYMFNAVGSLLVIVIEVYFDALTLYFFRYSSFDVDNGPKAAEFIKVCEHNLLGMLK